MNINDLEWEQGSWKTPDGKQIPFDRASLNYLLNLQTDDEVQITRWPRKVTIDIVTYEGEDGYTHENMGDGYVFEVSRAVVHRLITTDRPTLERDFQKLMDEVEYLVEGDTSGDYQERSWL